jgi:hypothetical protein
MCSVTSHKWIHYNRDAYKCVELQEIYLKYLFKYLKYLFKMVSTTWQKLSQRSNSSFQYNRR